MQTVRVGRKKTLRQRFLKRGGTANTHWASKPAAYEPQERATFAIYRDS